ncbi:hypothetical protein GcM3_200063 [Golovinomyces cichoracearum]|uniref:Secreted effector protein n=1 Tax=Golovinomyces cichoracearum TaxID=62708 RepID=A0A420HDW3_9PEZI|nr:hypothetical protein GcM3_200063 [Golovinomyces cichoracearum]
MWSRAIFLMLFAFISVSMSSPVIAFTKKTPPLKFEGVMDSAYCKYDADENFIEFSIQEINQAAQATCNVLHKPRLYISCIGCNHSTQPEKYRGDLLKSQHNCILYQSKLKKPQYPNFESFAIVSWNKKNSVCRVLDVISSTSGGGSKKCIDKQSKERIYWQSFSSRKYEMSASITPLRVDENEG